MPFWSVALKRNKKLASQVGGTLRKNKMKECCRGLSNGEAMTGHIPVVFPSETEAE